VQLLDQLKSRSPKKARSAYMIFVRENRSLISKNNPQLSCLEVMKQVGEKWQGLSEVEKQLYEDKSNKDKKRYKKDLVKFEREIEEIRTDSPIKRNVKEESNVKVSSKPFISKNKDCKKSLNANEESNNIEKGVKAKRASKAALKCENPKLKPRRKKGRKKNKPRRPLSAYVYFSQEVGSLRTAL
jgi:DNA repair ATPase RecN